MLRSDFVAGTTPATLRLAVPAGAHEVYLLFGDLGYAVHDTTVTGEQRTVTHSGDMPAGHISGWGFLGMITICRVVPTYLVLPA